MAGPGAGARMCQGGVKQEASGQIPNGLEGLAKGPHLHPPGRAGASGRLLARRWQLWRGGQTLGAGELQGRGPEGRQWRHEKAEAWRVGSGIREPVPHPLPTGSGDPPSTRQETQEPAD